MFINDAGQVLPVPGENVSAPQGVGATPALADVST